MTLSHTWKSEQELEDNLVAQLVEQGFESAAITDEKSLLANLKRQLEQLNGLTAKKQLSETEFK